MVTSAQDKLYDTALQTIGAAASLPFVKVDREEFLRKQFADSPHLEQILTEGPPAVYSVESLRRKAYRVVSTSATRSSAASFAAGLPSNPLTMIPAGGADVAQYFAFGLNMAQKVAFLFGEDDLFDSKGELSEDARIRVIAYLGAMFGASGAAALVASTSRTAGQAMGKKVAAQALTKTAWYPLVKKTGALIGQQVTKKTVEKTITKTVPVVGGVVSGGLTYATFRPMGQRLVDVFATNLTGGYDDQMELSEDFIRRTADAEDGGADVISRWRPEGR